MARAQNLDLSASHNFTEENFTEEIVTVPPRRMFKRRDCWNTMIGNEEVEIEVYNLKLTEHPVTGDVFTSLDHHNVVKIRQACFNINDDTPEPLLIRRFEAGMTSLGDFLSSQNATLSEIEQIDIFLKACNGLRYIHEKGIIHCSIGLQSIALVQDAGGGFTVKLKDFRRARMEGDSSVSERPLHPWVASGPFSKFAPPEATKWRKMHYTKKIDVYLLGIAMLEVATWKKISWAHHLFKYGDPVRIAKEKSDQPFRDIITDCLEDDPKKRATSANVYSKLRQEEMTLSLKLALEGNTSITMSVVRILFIGPPEVGKSSLKHVLVHNEPKAIKFSTAMLESPDFVRVTSDQCIVDVTSVPSSMESNWELVNERAMITAIQDTVLTGKPPKENLQRKPSSLNTVTGVLGTTNQQPTNGSNLSTSARYSPNVAYQNAMNGQCIQDPSFQKEGISTSESTAQIEECDDHGTLDMWDIALKEVRKTYDCDKPEFKLEETQLVHILDTGGQPCFHDVLSVFLDVPCTYALVFKASAAEKFHQKASITYRYNTNPEGLSTDATQNYIRDGPGGHSPQSTDTESMNLMFSVEPEGQSHEIGNENSDLGVQGAHSSSKKLQSKSKAHQNIEMETKTPFFLDSRMESHTESSLSSEMGLQTPGIGLESPQRLETIGSSPHSPEAGTESQHSRMKSPHSPEAGTESQHSRMKTPHSPEAGTESQHSRMKSPHSPEAGTESQDSQMKSPHSPEAGTEGQHSRMKSPHSPEAGTEGQHSRMKTPHSPEAGTESQDSQMKSPHSPEAGTESQHSQMKSPHSPEAGTESQHSQMKSPHSPEAGTESQHSQMKSPHSPEAGTESQHSRMKSPHSPEAGTESQDSQMKSPHSPEAGTESQHSRMKSPHSPEAGTESHHGFGLGTKRLQSSEMGTEGQYGCIMELKGLRISQLETENQHGLGMETKRLHNREMGTKGQCRIDLGIKSPHSLEIGTEGQHRLEMGTNSSRETGMETESQRDQSTSPCRSEAEVQNPHRSQMGTENEHSLGMRTKSPNKCEIGQQTEAQSPRNPGIGTDNQHQPAVHCMRSVLPTDQKELQMLQRLCSTIQTMRLKDFGNLAELCGVQHEPRPRICLIGTFKDEISESSLPEARSKIEAAFQEYLESRNLSRSVIKDKDSFFFLLNALERMEDPEHAQYINNLRKSLSESESAIKIRIPLMWYQLQEITVRVSSHFVKYKLLESFAVKNSFCSDSSDQPQSFRTFVRLFHLLGFYAYFDLPDTPDDRNWVCTNATIFYQQVSKLLAVQFIPDKDLKPSTENFKRTGLLVHHTEANDFESDNFVEDLHLDTTMDLDWFFSVLCHLGVAAKVKQSGKQLQSVFFIPAALPERDGSIHTFQTSVPPICISLKLQDSIVSQHHYTLPQGIFAQVAVKFLNTFEGCELCKSATNFRGSIKFRSNKYSAVIQLTEVASHIEVAVQVQELFCEENSLTGMEQLHKFCSQVRKLIKSVTDDVCDRQYPGIANKDESKVIYGFSCCCEKAATEPHLAEVYDFEEDGKPTVSMVCNKEGMQEQYQPLSTEQRLWFTSARTENIEIVRSQVDLETGQTVKYLSLRTKQSSSVGSSHPMSKLYDDALVETLPDVRCKISLDDLLSRLEVPSGGFMTQAERNLVISQRAEQEKVDKIFEILRKKSDQDIKRFIVILNKSGNEACAKALQQKLDKKFKEMPNRSRHQSMSTSQVQGYSLSPSNLLPHSHSLPNSNGHHDGGLVHFSPF